jgi:hypothetical protein
MSKLDDWLGIRERQGKLPQVKKVARASRPRKSAAKLRPHDPWLVAELSPALMQRLCSFVAKGEVPRTFNYYIERLLTEALDQRGYLLHPGRGGGQRANTDIDLHPLSLELSHADEEQ